MDIAKTAMVCLTAIAIMFSIVECNRSIYAPAPVIQVQPCQSK